MPTDVQPIAGSAVQTKWKEPYASASVNRRPVGVTAPGIYRGLVLEADPLAGDRTVVVAADTTRTDHVAVYESADGYSLNYRDSTSGDITLSLTAYASQTVVISIFVEYVVGTSTSATYRVYTVTEYDALSAADRGELVVLGTVTVPAASNPILAASILLDRRTLASSNIPKGAVPLAPILRNPGFEIGEAAATYKNSAVFWEKSTSAGTATWTTSSVDVHTGLRVIDFAVAVGPATARLTQEVGMEVQEGQILSGEVAVKQLQLIAAGTMSMFFDWGAANGSLLSTTTIDLDGGAVDTAYRQISTYVAVPSGATSLRAAGIQAAGLTPAAPGDVMKVDAANVFVEPFDPRLIYPFFDESRAPLGTTSLSFRDPAAGAISDSAPILRYDQTADELLLDARNPSTSATKLVLPESLDTPKIESGSGLVSVTSPTAFSALMQAYQNLEVRKIIQNLGIDLRAAAADAVVARIGGQAATNTYSNYTLIMEILSGDGAGDFRLYIQSDSATLTITLNARYVPSTDKWIKQDGTIEASKYDWKYERFSHYVRLPNAAPADITTGFLTATWTDVQVQRTNPNEFQLNDHRINYALGVGTYANPAETVAFKNHLMAKNMCAAWGRVYNDANNFDLAKCDGYNWDSSNYDVSTTKMTIHFPTGGEMSSAYYSVVGTVNASLLPHAFMAYGMLAGEFQVSAYDITTPTSIDWETDVLEFSFVVYAEQS